MNGVHRPGVLVCGSPKVNRPLRFLAPSVLLVGILVWGGPAPAWAGWQRKPTPDPYFDPARSQAGETSELNPEAAPPLKLPPRGALLQPTATGSQVPPRDDPPPRTAELAPIPTPGGDSIIRPLTPMNQAPATQTNRPANPVNPAKGEAFEPGKVLALVGGEPIFVGDMMFEINQLIEQHMPGAPESVKAQQRSLLIPKILPKFVEAKILFQGALQDLPEGVDVEKVIGQAAQEFDDKALPEMMKSAGAKSVAEFDAQLRAQDTSLRQLRRSWSVDQLTKYFVAQRLGKIPEITHQQLLDEYRNNLDSYAEPAQARWEQIMIRYDKSPSPAAARKQLVELGNQVVYGANLNALARESSQGFMAHQGGQHDWTTKGALVLKELDEAIFTLPVGELSDIIETRDGVHIIRVLERKEARHKPFRDAQVEIKERLINERRQDEFRQYMEELKREIPVEYLVND